MTYVLDRHDLLVSKTCVINLCLESHVHRCLLGRRQGSQRRDGKGGKRSHGDYGEGRG